MLVIYRINPGFEGDIVTVMTGDPALAAALAQEDTAILDVALGTTEAADLLLHPAAFVVRDSGTGPALYRRES